MAFVGLLVLGVLQSCCKEEPEDVLPPGNDPEVEVDALGIQDRVFYEVNLRAFSSDGDLQGVLDKLDHIESLGVNVIWLMPIHPIGTINSVNSPYSVQDYTAISTEYGTLDDFKALVEAAHDRGMAVVMDWVANHTAWDHPWITNVDWYTQDANGNIIHPAGTNWQDVADLNFDNPAMREQMIADMQFWLDVADVDGFRCDAADWVPLDFWTQAISALRSSQQKDILMLAEGADPELLEVGFDLNFGWNWYDGIKNVFNGNTAASLVAINEGQLAGLPENKSQLRFTTNHDESAWDATPVEIFGGLPGALSAHVATVFMGGVPLIYGSQEVGQSNPVPFFSQSPINWNQNPAFLETFQAVMSIYSERAVARHGDVSDASNGSVVSFVKYDGGEQLWVVANTRNVDKNLSVPSGWQGSWTDALTGEPYEAGEMRTLAPYQWTIWSR